MLFDKKYYYAQGYITARDGHGLTGIKADTIAKWMHRGRLPSIKAGRDRLFLRRDLEALIEEKAAEN